jgi:hypothetical protein
MQITFGLHLVAAGFRSSDRQAGQVFASCEEVLRTYDSERDRDAKFRFGQDDGVAAYTYLTFANWLLGEVGDTRARITEATARGVAGPSPRQWSSDEFEDGLAYGRQGWLRRRPVDSFFPALLFLSRRYWRKA